VNGALNHRISNTTNLCIEYTDSSALVMALDLKGVSCSNGSACASGNPDPSHVLLAMGLSQEKAHASLRFSVGHSTTEQEVRDASKIINETVQNLRSTHPLWNNRMKHTLPAVNN
jgi:cysteine desulfurase